MNSQEEYNSLDDYIFTVSACGSHAIFRVTSVLSKSNIKALWREDAVSIYKGMILADV